jgi:hypothetical protein
MSHLTTAEIEVVARLRHLPIELVRGFARIGFMQAGCVDGHRCFIMRERAFAQARRLDGTPFTGADGRDIKAKNLPGSKGAFTGRYWLGGPSVRVLLVEGVIGLLEAFVAHEMAAPSPSWTIVAATSAQSRFARDPDLLKLLAGRFVRIVPDMDDAGLKGAGSWLRDLEAVGATVEAFKLPPKCKDLGAIATAPEIHHQTLKSLFQ